MSVAMAAGSTISPMSGISDDDKVSKLDFLKVITKPLTKIIISIDKGTIKDIAKVSGIHTVRQLKPAVALLAIVQISSA